MADTLRSLLVDDEAPARSLLREYLGAHPDVQVIGWRPVTYSFPSGHSASAVAGAFIVSLMVPELRVLLWTLAFGIAFSRVYLGVHYPVDVVAGVLVGWAIGVVVTGGRHWYRPFQADAGSAPSRVI